MGDWQNDYTKGLFNPGADPANPATLQGQIDSGVYGKPARNSGGGGGGGSGGEPAPRLIVVLLVFLLLPLVMFATSIGSLAPVLQGRGAAIPVFPPILPGVAFLVIGGALAGAVPVSLLMRRNYLSAAVKLARCLLLYSVITLALAVMFRGADSMLAWARNVALSDTTFTAALNRLPALLMAMPGFLFVQLPAAIILGFGLRKDFRVTRSRADWARAFLGGQILVAVMAPVAAVVANEIGLASFG
ncbi:MAG TPA: hypothetical protein VG942_07240 [Hyphomonadaceae bacterium]|nr:hypothetical protein [Hyphomonadaceae bacterium]